MGTKGMYYYYHAFATALDASGLEEIKDKDGEKHAWAAELAKKLGGLQQADGTWAGDKQWMEDMPPLPTLYSLMALNKARAHVK
jgi:squalene-hopene/tetraprenyl-beta-curcumene cyclase